MLFSAQSIDELADVRAERALGFPLIPMEQADFDRAIDVMAALAAAGRHRAASIPDLLLAAVAERNALTVLHYDYDFDVIASVTRQAVQWVAPRGSLR